MKLLKQVKERISNIKKTREKKKLKHVLNTLEKIQAKTFFKIMETDDLKLLNPKKKKVSQKSLEKTWLNLREEFYKLSSKSKYEQDLSASKKILSLKTELSILYAGINFYELFGKIHECFKEIGYDIKDGKDIQKLKQKIKVKQTKLGILELKRKKHDKAEVIDFWEMFTDLQSSLNQLGILNGTLSPEMNMMQWINYTKSIKKVNGYNRKRESSKSKRG